MVNEDVYISQFSCKSDQKGLLTI